MSINYVSGIREIGPNVGPYGTPNLFRGLRVPARLGSPDGADNAPMWPMYVIGAIGLAVATGIFAFRKEIF